MTTLEEMFTRQHRLQVESFKKDPCTLEGEELVEFIRWNIIALEDELHEVLAEVTWKPWSSAPREIRDKPAYLKELVDAIHFLMNLVLAATSSPIEAAETIGNLYRKKADVNAQRQEDGYTGLNKCRSCHRDYEEAGTYTAKTLVKNVITSEMEQVVHEYCSVCHAPVIR